MNTSPSEEAMQLLQGISVASQRHQAFVQGIEEETALLQFLASIEESLSEKALDQHSALMLLDERRERMEDEVLALSLELVNAKRPHQSDLQAPASADASPSSSSPSVELGRLQKEVAELRQCVADWLREKDLLREQLARVASGGDKPGITSEGDSSSSSCGKLVGTKLRDEIAHYESMCDTLIRLLSLPVSASTRQST